MNVTFDDEVPAKAHATLSWLAERSRNVGISIKTLLTKTPDSPPECPVLINYLFAYNDDEDSCHITVNS